MSNSMGGGLSEIGGGSKIAADDFKRNLLRRGPWQTASTVVIVAGILMLVQPFALALYTYSFAVILAGSVAFVITSHFPE
jgi:hypothetical protein